MYHQTPKPPNSENTKYRKNHAQSTENNKQHVFKTRKHKALSLGIPTSPQHIQNDLHTGWQGYIYPVA